MFVAPMIDLEHGIAHAQRAHSVAQLLVEYCACIVEVLVVDTHGKHKVFPLELGHLLSPRHLMTCLQSGLHTPLPVLAGIIYAVRQGHVLVKECQSLLLLLTADGVAPHKQKGKEPQRKGTLPHKDFTYLHTYLL